MIAAIPHLVRVVDGSASVRGKRAAAKTRD
jgi:hypothetical protein